MWSQCVWEISRWPRTGSWVAARICWPSSCAPVPQSSTISVSSARTSTHDVLPPYRTVPGPGLAIEPRVPQKRIRIARGLWYATAPSVCSICSTARRARWHIVCTVAPQEEIPMAETAADILIDTIHDWGVEVVFGLPGDGINGIMEALRKRQDTVRFVQVRHEEAAAFMACGYAKFTGRLGVCLATSGPGGIHLLNGLYDAKLDNQPVLAITGHHFHDLIDTHSQQDINLDRVLADVAVYNTRIMGKAHVESVTDLASRAALAYRGVATLTVPVDFQSMTEKDRSARNLRGHADTIALGRRVALPAEEELRRAA